MSNLLGVATLRTPCLSMGDRELHGWSSPLMIRSYLFNKKEQLVVGTKYKGSTFCYRYLISCSFQSITLRLAYYYLCFTGLLSADVSGYFKAGSEGSVSSCSYCSLFLFDQPFVYMFVYVCRYTISQKLLKTKGLRDLI